MRRERLLFGVKPSGRIFFSYIYQRVRVISIFEEAHESMRERNQISTRWFRGYGYILSPTVSVQIIHITILAPLKLFYITKLHCVHCHTLDNTVRQFIFSQNSLIQFWYKGFRWQFVHLNARCYFQLTKIIENTSFNALKI